MPGSAYSDPPTFTPLQTLTAAQQNALGDAIRAMYWWSAAGSISYAYDADQLEELLAPARAALLTHNGSIPAWLTVAAAAADALKTVRVNAAGDGFELGASGFDGASVRRTTGLTIPNASYTVVPFDTEDLDTSDYWDSGSNTSFTAPYTGKYLVFGRHDFASNATNIREIRIVKGGTVTSANTLATDQRQGNSEQGTFLGLWNASASDFVELYAWQNSGGNLNLDAATLSIVFLGA